MRDEGRVECSIFFVRVWRLTVSKALVRSRAVTSVLDGGLFWLKPADMECEMLWSAVLVLCWGLKPCWWFGELRCSCSVGRMRRSMIFATGESREIGL